MTKQATYKGVPVTDELEEEIAAQTLAELAAMSDEEVEAHKREPGSLAKRIGRPRLGDGRSVLLRPASPPNWPAGLNRWPLPRIRTVPRSCVKPWPSTSPSLTSASTWLRPCSHPE